MRPQSSKVELSKEPPITNAWTRHNDKRFQPGLSLAVRDSVLITRVARKTLESREGVALLRDRDGAESDL